MDGENENILVTMTYQFHSIMSILQMTLRQILIQSAKVIIPQGMMLNPFSILSNDVGVK